MALSSEYLNENGEAGCISCRKTTPFNLLESCAACNRFVCKSCAIYRKQGNPYGYVCKSCNQKSIEFYGS